MGYAIVETGGRQIRVEKDLVVRIPKVGVEKDGEITLDRVLYFTDGKKAKIGNPYVEGACVTARIVTHGKDKKIKVFKFKRRKDYKKLKGHRQDYSEIKVTALSIKPGAEVKNGA